MKAIQIISQDVFDKVRSRFSNLEMGDETGAVTIDPAEARFFDFDFVQEGNNLGRVSISLNDLGSLKIYYSQGITENQDDLAKQMWYSFLKEMRMFAMRRLLRFDTRDIAKTNLDKNDFQHLAATQGPKDDDMTNTMNESRWSQKSTKKTSRAVKGTTEVIVRHHSSMDEMYPGARSQRKNIKAIFIQNKEGERYKYPFIHPAGAFAMAQHVDHGGAPYDPAGKAIIKMSEQIAQLQEFQRKIQKASLHDDAMGITDRAVGRLQELKNCVECLGKRHHYQAWIAEFNEQEHMDDDIMELDAVTMEEYKSKFTETNFKEELASFFPLLHNIMREANKVDLEDYVSKTDEELAEKAPEGWEGTVKAMKKHKEIDNPYALTNWMKNKGMKSHKKADEEFAEWAESVEQGKLTDDQIQSLKTALADTTDLQLGPDGQTAWQFFNGLGIEDTDLEDKLKSAASLDSTADPVEVFKMWAQESYPELLVALGMSDTQPPAEEPAPEVGVEPAPMPAPEQPVGEGFDAVESNYEEWEGILEKDGYRDPDVSGADALKLVAGDHRGPEGYISTIRNILTYVKQNSEVLGKAVADRKTVKDCIMDIKNEYPQYFQAAQQPQEVAEGMDVDSVLSNIEKEVRQQAGHDDWELIQIKLLDAALKMVGRDKRSTYEPDVLNVIDWDDAAEFLNTVANDAGQSENTDMTPPPGAMEEGDNSRAELTKMVAEKVKSFYNVSNENVAPFRAEENIATDIKKDVAEKFGEAAGEHAREMALAFMEKKNQEWKVANGHGDDGLARLKELVGNIKSKVEGIGDQGHSGEHFNKNIMPAEDQAEAYNPNSAAAEHARELKAHHRKDLETKAKSGDESAKRRLQALNDKEERMRNDYNARMERESTEMESILRLAGLAK